jgi:hypothetical protein
MDGEIIEVPKPQQQKPAYSRAECLRQIIESASMQLRQDADHLEQEDLALDSRLIAIQAQITIITENDPVLK